MQVNYILIKIGLLLAASVVSVTCQNELILTQQSETPNTISQIILRICETITGVSNSNFSVSLSSLQENELQLLLNEKELHKISNNNQRMGYDLIAKAICKLIKEFLPKEKEKDSEEKLWQDYKKKFSKNYNDQAEDSQRKMIYQSNRNKISTRNSSQSFYSLEENQFADLSHEDALSHLTGLKIVPELKKKLEEINVKAARKSRVVCVGDKSFEKLSKLQDAPIALQSRFDWRQSAPNRVGAVKNQSYCGMDWAFAATGLLEGQISIKANILTDGSSLSEQNILDCSSSDVNCHSGGSAYVALKQIDKRGGIMTSEDYPYAANQSHSGKSVCKFRKTQAKIRRLELGLCSYPSNKHEYLKDFLQKVGPIAVPMHVKDDFWFYKSGIYKADECFNSLARANHEVLLVGYGRDAGKKLDYWILKNSWGKDWGENGYFKVAIGDCGIGSFFTVAAVER